MGTGWSTKLALGVFAVAVAIATAAPEAAGAPDDHGVVRFHVADARRSHGLHPLGQHPALEQVAARQVQRMRDAGAIFHNDRLAAELSDITPDWTVASENVGMGPSVLDIEDAFMHSKVHKRNILSGRYNAVGIAVATDGYGRRFVAQVFAHVDGMVLAEDGTPVAPAYYAN